MIERLLAELGTQRPQVIHRQAHGADHALVADAAAAVGADGEIAADSLDADVAGAVRVDGHVALHVLDLDVAGAVVHDVHAAATLLDARDHRSCRR